MATSWYVTIACAQLHKPTAALDALEASSGLKSGTEK